ncbi:MAG TPA: tRNA pseudouridine(13) synthase TruD, partial [Luteimonas sp.]|nr:tRNA pseudouridine(13) synthase TruD [Luteimonas sp.]
MRASADDFHVEELAAFEPTGQGEHLLLTVEKRSTNTAHVARLL